MSLNSSPISHSVLGSPASICEHVGAQARALRLAKGIPQADLAAAAGVAHSTLKRFEAGRDVRFEVVVRIMLALRRERVLADAFAPDEERSMDEILRAQRRPMRARRSRP